jgi:hypothetical protein
MRVTTTRVRVRPRARALLLRTPAALGEGALRRRVDLDLGLCEARRGDCILHEFDADGVDSVALIRLCVLLSIENMAEVAAAGVAYDLNVHPSRMTHANVALPVAVVALVEGVPTAVLELAR